MLSGACTYWKAQRVVGEGAYSPGLEHGAQLYETGPRCAAFALMPRAYLGLVGREKSAGAVRCALQLRSCEELGSRDLLQELRRLRFARDSRLLHYIYNNYIDTK